ncbi:hypothetical protein CLV48_1199 [Cecembia rubra]|uniref:Ig-like domain-containing protein n=1 Tax=Cecembia rubra TaxID=1485585 RepID=A0A2P8DM70_9BACT|nr:hypothetical protein CLV48_1199 [Cecembia rubra]
MKNLILFLLLNFGMSIILHAQSCPAGFIWSNRTNCCIADCNCPDYGVDIQIEPNETIGACLIDSSSCLTYPNFPNPTDFEIRWYINNTLISDSIQLSYSLIVNSLNLGSGSHSLRAEYRRHSSCTWKNTGNITFYL